MILFFFLFVVVVLFIAFLPLCLAIDRWHRRREDQVIQERMAKSPREDQR